MSSFVFNGEQAMVFPTIGVTANPGDVFDAPDDFVADDVTPAKVAKKATATIEEAPVAEPAPVEEGTN